MYVFEETQNQLSRFELKQFILVPKALVKEITHQEALLLSAYMRFAWDKNNCFPSYDKLSTVVGIKGSRLAQISLSLRKKGMISAEIRGNGYAPSKITFLWNPIWEKCLKSKKLYPKGADGKRLEYGQPFAPAKILSCYLLPEFLAGCDDVSPKEKIVYAYLLCRIGRKGVGRPSHNDMVVATGISRMSVIRTMKKIEEYDLVRQVGEHVNGTTKTFVLPLVDALKCDFIRSTSTEPTCDIYKLSCTQKETRKRFKKEGNSEEKLTSNFSQNKNNEEPEAPEAQSGLEEVVSFEAVEQVIPNAFKQVIAEWIAEIPRDLPDRARLSILVQMVMTKGIESKPAYFNTLVRKAREGSYETAGLPQTLRKFLKHVYSKCRSAGMSVGQPPLKELGLA